MGSPGQQEEPIKKPLKSRVWAVPCTGRQGGDRDSAGQGLYVQFLEKGVRKTTGGRAVLLLPHPVFMEN